MDADQAPEVHRIEGVACRWCEATMERPACNRRFDSPHIERDGPFDHLVAAKGFKILACGNGHTARYPHHSQFRSRRPRPLPRLSLHRRRQPQQFLRLTSPRLPRHCLRGSAPRSGRRVRHIGLCLAYRPSPARRLLCVTPREPTAQMPEMCSSRSTRAALGWEPHCHLERRDSPASHALRSLRATPLTRAECFPLPIQEAHGTGWRSRR